jgi:hypothetical protein
MSAFEDFVTLELPRRPVMLTAELCGGYTGDPNDGGAPIIVQNSPKGTFYLRGSNDTLWKKESASPGTWGEVGGASSGTEAALTLTVDGTSGSDTPSVSRPAVLYGGDYSAYPFQTIQAAVNSFARDRKETVVINVIAAGNYTGVSFKALKQAGLTINGLQDLVTPTTGPATGTATSGTSASLTLTGAGWTPDNFVGKFCKIISGAGAGQHFIIATNTADTLTFAGRMSPAPNATSVFQITEPKTRLTVAYEFTSGLYSYNNVGTFTVQDFHIEGPTFGVVHLTSLSSLTLRRVTAKNCYYSFVGQESAKAAWSQIGSLGSSSNGIIMLAMLGLFANSGYEKGWLVINAAGGSTDGIRIDSCRGGVQGVYVKGCGNNGIYAYASDTSFYYVTLDNNKDGAWISRGVAFFNNISCSNNTNRGIASDYGGRIDLSGTIAGTGNGQWGVHAGAGVGGIVTLTALPTITGTLGNATVDGANALVWATDFDTVNEYAYNIARDARIVRAA